MEFPVDANTLAYWPLNEDQNSQINVTSLRAAVSDTAKEPDFGLTASGVGQDINIGATNTLRFEQSSPFSISAWIVPLNATAVACILGNGAVTTNRGYELRVTNGDVLQLRLTNTVATAEFIISHAGASLNDGLEHHIVLTYDGTHTQAGTKFYIDNVLRSTNAPTTNTLAAQTIVSTGSLKIGKNGDNATADFYEGGLRQLSIWNVALTAGNVTTLFNGGVPGDLSLVSFVANLLAWWKIQAADNYAISGGVIDSATVGPFNGTAEGGLAIPPSTQLSATSLTQIPKIAGGPRQALDLGQDNCRWFSLSSTGAATTFMRAGLLGFTRDALASSSKCMLGTAWTYEGWAYIDRDPTVLGAIQSIMGFDGVGVSNTQDLGTLKITTAKKLQITWESVPATTRTATSTGNVPVQQWFHFAVIGIINGANRDIQFYISGVDAGLVTGLPRAATADCALNTWEFGQNPNTSNLPLFGGLAYVRVSDKARSLAEIALCSAEPANIIKDVNTVAIWTFQDVPQIRDRSPFGLHLIQRGQIQGVDAVAPFDVFAAQGPASHTPGHYFANSNSNTSLDASTRQSLASAFTDLNEYTIETFLKMENNTGSHQLFISGGPTTSGLTALDNNITALMSLTSTQRLSIKWQAEERFGWTLESERAIVQTKNSSGEFSDWYGLAVRKKNAGQFKYWKEDGVDDATSMGNAAAYSFEFGNSFSIIVWASSINLATQHLAGKSESDANPAGYALFLNTSGQLAFRVQGNTGTQRAEKSANIGSPAQADGFEHFLGATYDGSSVVGGIALYIDGVAQGSVNNVSDTLDIQSAANALAIEIKNDFNAHRVSTVFHSVADNTNVVSSNSNSLPTLILLVNEIKVRLNSHYLNFGGAFHPVTDTVNTITQADATDMASALALLTALKNSYNAHRTQATVHLSPDNTNVVTSVLSTNSMINASAFTVGRRDLVDQAHKGYIRQVSVWNRVLTAAEMAAAYDMAGSPPDLLSTSMASALIGWWKFDAADTNLSVVDHSVSGVNGTPQGGLGPTLIDSSTYDFLVNGAPFGTTGPLPNAKIGNVYLANTAQYFQTLHLQQTEESRSATRISNIARSDAEIASLYADLTREGTSLEYKMRAVDDGRPNPGYIYWITNFPDFQASQVGTATPPLIGHVVPGSVIMISSWPV